MGNIFLIIFGIFFILILGTFALGGFLAAPWVPLWRKDIRRMLNLAKIKPGELVYDLGAGDGRIIIAAAKDFKAKAIGFEIAILPYLLAYIKIISAGVLGRAKMKYRDFFSQDLNQADVICAFLTPAAMAKLKPKLEKETKPGCRILSFAFSIPGWKPVVADKSEAKRATVYLYQR